MPTLVKITYIEREYRLNEDGEFRCTHKNIEITPPCCTSAGPSGYIECGCGGKYNVYCPDCDNEDLTDSEVEEILENYEG